MVLRRQLASLHKSHFTVRTIGHNVTTLSRPTRQLERSAYRLGVRHAYRGPHPLDRFEQRETRFIGWDIPSPFGLAGSLGSPGFGVVSASVTSVCWAIAFGGSGLSHLRNGVRCRRRRSLWSGPLFVAIALLGLGWGTGDSVVMWDNLWVGAFVVWSFWFVHDRRRPHRRYSSFRLRS
jgi:hypothetical protein